MYEQTKILVYIGNCLHLGIFYLPFRLRPRLRFWKISRLLQLIIRDVNLQVVKDRKYLKYRKAG